MVINLIPLGYVTNYDKNRYLELFSKAAETVPSRSWLNNIFEIFIWHVCI